MFVVRNQFGVEWYRSARRLDAIFEADRLWRDGFMVTVNKEK